MHKLPWFAGKTSLLIDFFKSLDSFLGPQLTTLVSSVAEQCAKHVAVTPESCSTKYLYFNKLNLAYKSTIHLDNRRCSNVLTTPEVLRIITDIYNDTNKYIHHWNSYNRVKFQIYVHTMLGKNCALFDFVISRLNEAGEIIIKTMSDYWIIAKLSNLREFFVVIQQKSASIIEIDGTYNIIYDNIIGPRCSH